MPRDNFLQLPNEILHVIFLRLSSPDLARCMRLCKRFKAVLSTQEFWKNYVKVYYNLDPVNLDAEKLKSDECINLGLLMNDWKCFWDDSYTTPASDDPTRYIFKPFIKKWANGILTPGNFNFEPLDENVAYNYYALNKALYLLSTLRRKCDEFQIMTVPYYSTLDSDPDVCLFPWPGEELPKPDEVLEIFNVHKEIIRKSDYSEVVHVSEKLDYFIEDLDDEDDDDYTLHTTSLNNTFRCNENEEQADELFQWLQNLFQPSLMFCSGVDAIHPQFYFHLTTLSQGWVGGIFATIGLI